MKSLILISFLICTIAGIPSTQSHPNITIPPSTSDTPVTSEQLSSSTVKIPLTFEASTTSKPSIFRKTIDLPDLCASLLTHLEEHCAVTYGISGTLGSTIVKTLFDYQSRMQQWTNSKIELSDEYFFKTDLALNYENYLVTFEGIFITQKDELPQLPLSSEIHCIFSDLLQVTIPIQEDRLQFQGLVKILNKKQNTFIENNFNITFNNLRVLLTSRTNHTAYQNLLNNQTQFEILYDNSEIAVKSSPKYESTTTKALTDLIPEIRSYFEAKITHQLSTILENVSFSDLSTYCMRPLTLISNIPPNMVSKHRYYFKTDEKFITLNNYSITLELDEANIDGMLNITHVHLIQKNNSIAFSFLIKNLNGSSSWTYYDDDMDTDLQVSMPFNFTIDGVIIKGTFSDGLISDVHLDFESFDVTSESKGLMSSLSNKILQPELKKVITKKVDGALRSAIVGEQFTQIEKLNVIASKALDESGKIIRKADEALKREKKLLQKLRIIQ